ncbi:MAG: hypothetical protein ACLQDM_00725 [Bradyrhizobium sp.]
MSGRRPVAQESDSADDQLRWTLSSWRQRQRHRTEAFAGYRKGQVRHSVQTDLDRELKRGRYTEWQWFLIPLLVLTIIDFLWLRRWS